MDWKNCWMLIFKPRGSLDYLMDYWTSPIHIHFCSGSSDLVVRLRTIDLGLRTLFLFHYPPLQNHHHQHDHRECKAQRGGVAHVIKKEALLVNVEHRR